ncbi:MAG: AAA family ATPase, partial [Myxococcota bacterium]
LRYAWMTELCPSCRVVHLDEVLPQAPEEHPDFWNLWRTSLRRLVPDPLDHVFASETYGLRLAQELEATFIPVDIGRDALRISGTAVREAPFKHWAHLPPPVRAYACQRISIYGPESCGKTTLAQALAQHFETAWVPEYARVGLEHGAPLAVDSLKRFMRAQAASEDALARSANRRLFCDTDPSVTPLWAKLLLGRAIPPPPSRHYDLTLLLRPDVPFVDDDVRYAPEARTDFFEDCQRLLNAEQRRMIVIGGSFQERLRQAIDAVSSLPHPNLNEARPKA